MSQGKALGDQLAEHQRDVGHHHHDGAEGQLLGIGREQGYVADHRGQLLGISRAAVYAGEDADQRDADLHRRQQARGILEQRQRRAGAAMTLFGQPSQA